MWKFTLSLIAMVSFLASAGFTTNLVENSSFEAGLDNWDPYQNVGLWQTGSDDAYEGTFSCQTVVLSPGYYDASIRTGSYDIPIIAGIPYRIIYWIKERDTHDTWDSNASILDGFIQLDAVTYNFVPLSPPPTEWSKVDTVVTFPSGGIATLEFQLHGYSTSANGKFWLDAVSVTPILDCGDMNGDGAADISDLTYFVDWLFNGSPGPCPVLSK